MNMKHVSEALFVLVLLALMALSARCTIKVETPPWPDGGIVAVPPIQVPCPENLEAGWVCRWPESGTRLYVGQLEPCPRPGRCDIVDRPVCGPTDIYYHCDENGWWNAEQTDAATCERWCQ